MYVLVEVIYAIADINGNTIQPGNYAVIESAEYNNRQLTGEFTLVGECTREGTLI